MDRIQWRPNKDYERKMILWGIYCNEVKNKHCGNCRYGVLMNRNKIDKILNDDNENPQIGCPFSASLIKARYKIKVKSSCSLQEIEYKKIPCDFGLIKHDKVFT